MEPGPFRALIAADGMKLIERVDGNLLFDLEADPGERRNLSKLQPERARAMSETLNAYLDSLPAPGPAGPPRRIDAETEDALRGLGYLE